MAAGPPGTLVYSVAMHSKPSIFTGKWRFSQLFTNSPERDAEQALLKTTPISLKIMKLVLRKCSGKFAPVDRKGAALPLCPAPRSRDGRH